MSERTLLALVTVAVLITAVGAPPAGATQSQSADGPQIVELYPNPVAENNTGEYVVVEFPEPTNTTGWTITDDGREEAHLPNTTLKGTVAFSLDPAYARNHTDLPVKPLTGWLRPAVGGDRIELRQDGTIVDAVEYERAPESERWVRADGGKWVPMGATGFDPVRTTPESVETFVLPDAQARTEQFLSEADQRLYVAGYTFTSPAATEALIEASERGVAVRVLVDGAPVGGITDRQVRALDRLNDAGINVTVLGGEHARYRFHHAKYAVVDDRALVLTENWKPSGTGGRSNRGWGVRIDDEETAATLATVFETDATWRDGIAWETYRQTVDPVHGDPADGEHPARFDAASVAVEAVQVLVAPDNAEEELLGLIDDANESIRIQQVNVGGVDSSLVAATIDAARRGVTVELQLSSAWYVEEENRKVAAELERIAGEEDLPITVHLVEPRSRFETVHTKGAVVDDRHVVLGSINWNEHSLRENREVAVVLTGEAAAAYYGDVLTADRRGGLWRLPVGLAVLVLFGLLTATGVCWRFVSWRPRSRSSCSPGPRRSPRRPSSRPAHREPPPDDP